MAIRRKPFSPSYPSTGLACTVLAAAAHAVTIGRRRSVRIASGPKADLSARVNARHYQARSPLQPCAQAYRRTPHYSQVLAPRRRDVRPPCPHRLHIILLQEDHAVTQCLDKVQSLPYAPFTISRDKG